MRHIYSTYKEHYKALIFLGLPIVIGQIGVIVLGFADTLMIGHHSTIELGAASFVNNVFNLAIIFSTLTRMPSAGLLGFLFGSILTVSWLDIALMSVCAGIAVGVVCRWFDPLQC